MKPIASDTYDFPTLVGKGGVYVHKQRNVYVGVNYGTLFALFRRWSGDYILERL